ncbi:uncharacterized protein LOC144141805 [Haemaphysalis longicornis]
MHCQQMANPEVEFDCDVYLHIRPLSCSSDNGLASFRLLPPSPTGTRSPSNIERGVEDLCLDCAKHWQAVFVFKSGNSDVEAATSDGIVMLEAGKETGYLMGQGYWTSHEVLDFERPRKVFLRSFRLSLKTLSTALRIMNESPPVYCLVWSNCQEWIAGLMGHLNVEFKRTRASYVVNVFLAAVACLCIFVYFLYVLAAPQCCWRWQGGAQHDPA